MFVMVVVFSTWRLFGAKSSEQELEKGLGFLKKKF